MLRANWPVCAAILAWALLSVLVLGLSLRQPWLGLDLEASGDGMRVAAAPTGSALAGQRLQAIGGADGGWLALQPGDLNPEPSYLSNYRELDAFYARQERLAEAQRQQPVHLLLADGRTVTLQVQPYRPLGSLPPHLFIQLAFGAMALLVSGIALARRQADPSARYFFLTALGYAVDVSVHGIYSSRELALHGGLFHALVSANHVCAVVLVSVCGAIVMLYFPRDLHQPRTSRLLLAAGCALALATECRWFARLEAFRAGIYVPFLLMIYFAVLQWRMSQGRPADRAMLSWMLVPYVLGASLYVFLLLVPASGGLGPRASQTWGWAMVLLIYLGLSLGMTRFRLFYVNPANLELWALGGALCAVTFTLLRWALELPAPSALWLALGMSGMAYFPLRDWLWRRQAAQFADFERVLPLVLDDALAARSAGEVAPHWRRVLERLYQPTRIDRAGPGRPPEPALLNDGEALTITALDGGEPLLLAGAYAGRSLFTPADLRLCVVLSELFGQLLRYWQERERGEQMEQARLAAKLDQQFMTRLATLQQQYGGNGEIGPRLGETMTEMQAITASLRGDRPETDPEHWHKELEQRCAAAGMRWDWRIHGATALPVLDRARARELLAIFREAVTNAIRHSGGSRVQVDWTVEGDMLRLSIGDNGIGREVADCSGHGVTNIRDRAVTIGARVEFCAVRHGGIAVNIELPVTQTGDVASAGRA